jgi:hypothetical protein
MLLFDTLQTTYLSYKRFLEKQIVCFPPYGKEDMKNDEPINYSIPEVMFYRAVA